MTTDKDDGVLSPEDTKKILEDIGDITDAVPADVADQIDAAEKGDKKASLKILESFCSTVDNGFLPEIIQLEYLSRCFHLLLEGVAPHVALGINKTASANAKPDIKERDFQYALEVARLVENGEVKLRAVESVTNKHYPEAEEAEEANKHYETVRQAYYKHQVDATVQVRLEASDESVKRRPIKTRQLGGRTLSRKDFDDPFGENDKSV